MDSISDIRKKVKKSIDHADDTTVKMVYAMLEVQENDANKEDEIFNQEMLRRIDEYEKGKVKTYSHDQLVAHVRTAHKNRMRSLK